jgi:FkbM family methyltransferase
VVHEDLIYDVGMNDGSDTAYYLSRGFRVLAIEANPLLVESAEERFARFIQAGKLRILNIGIADHCGILPFWVNHEFSGWSSFNHVLASKHGTSSRRLDVNCTTFDRILAEYGVPHYMKVDIEGYDSYCIDALETGCLPRYLSVEFFRGDFEHMLSRLAQLGYRRFKMIEQENHTSGMPIFPHERATRIIRKVCRRFRIARALIQSLPAWAKPNKCEFLRPPSPRCGDSGPFGEETHGRWRSFTEIRLLANWLHSNNAAIGLLESWYDLHAAF